MPSLHFEPEDITLEIDEQTTIREAAHQVDVNVHDRCGGNGACCNCVVTIVQGAEHLNPKTLVEEAVTYLDANDRLSCQCKITGPVIVKTTSF